MKKILIYAPLIGGHRQVYCNVITHWALESKMDVILCIGNDWCRGGNTISQGSPYIDLYMTNNNVDFVNASQKPPHKSDSEYLLDLENDIKPDLIFVISGDEFNNSLYSFMKDLIIPKRHSSKWVGIFISCFYYPDSANRLKQKVQKLMLKQKLKYFDRTYWLDEYFLNDTNIENIFWLPDISKSFNVDMNNDDAEFELLCPQIDNFLINNKGKDVLLFFGRDFNRKGFDFIIELALEDEQFIVLRAGDPLENMDESQEIMEKMSILEKNGRLLNIPKFIKNPIIISKLFQATNYILLPYRDHYSSSGVMLQAIEFQKPVVVPNIGLMGKRVFENHLGITYKHKNYDEFKKAVYKMQNEHYNYITYTITFYESFSKEAIFKKLDLMKEIIIIKK
ncbi:MAG: hypothetical protein GQ533_10620 [Methanosarcinaceae archaeon]|nr:hypothetical protein [Methanosarcinaceae archaeon]